MCVCWCYVLCCVVLWCVVVCCGVCWCVLVCVCVFFSHAPFSESEMALASSVAILVAAGSHL